MHGSRFDSIRVLSKILDVNDNQIYFVNVYVWQETVSMEYKFAEFTVSMSKMRCFDV